MKKDDSIDKIDKQIKELQEEAEHYNKMLDETIDEEEIDEAIEEEDEEDNTKEFINDEEEDEIDEEEDTKEYITEEEEEYKPKHQKEEEIKEEVKEEPKKEEEKPKKNNKKKAIIISLIIAIIIALLIIILVVINMNKKTTIEQEKEDTYSSAQLKKILKNYGNSIENVININLNNNKELLTYDEATKLVDFPNKVKCKTTEVYEDGKLYLEDCTIDGHKTKAKYGTKQEPKEETAEVAEGSFYVYEKNNMATLETPENKDEYQAYLVNTNTTPTNINLLTKFNAKYVFYTDDHGNTQIKNFKTDKYAVPLNNVETILPIKIDNNNYDTTYIGISDGTYWGIYNLNTGLTEIKMTYTTFAPNLAMGTIGMPEYINALTETNIAARDANNNIGVINYKTGEVVIPFDTNAMLKSGEYLWKYQYAFDDNTHQSNYTNKSIYDFDGNKYLANKYDDIYGIVNGKYILIKDGKNIKMILIDGKVLYNYGEIKNIGTVNYFIGYNDNPLFQFNKADISNTTDENQCIEVSYDTKTKKGAYKDYYCGGIAKPILYLYPTETTNVKITFDHPDLLKTTYPKYNKEWNITVKEDGTITDKNGRTYYALYWDEKQKYKVDFKEGFYVTSNNAIKFLEEKLFEIGLTEREANEFIMYWLPILEQNKKSLVYFELTKEREEINKINIEPKPDSLLRVTIHIKKVNKETKIKEQKLTQFNRHGFTAVEWGGTTY